MALNRILEPVFADIKDLEKNGLQVNAKSYFGSIAQVILA